MSTARDLLERIYAAPDDLILRRTLADLLLREGDPRGEMIDLQLRGQRPDRVDELVRTHAHRWLGPLKRMLEDIEFVNGFPQRARVATWSADVRAVLLTPPAATIRELLLDGLDQARLQEIAKDPDIAPRVAGLGVRVPLAQLATMLKKAPFPRLRTFTLGDWRASYPIDDVRALLALPACAHLTSLRVEASQHQPIAAWIELLSRDAPSLVTLAITEDKRTLVTLTREAGGFAATVGALEPWLFTEGLSAHVTRLELPPVPTDASAHTLGEIVNALTRAGFAAQAAAFDAPIDAKRAAEVEQRRRWEAQWEEEQEAERVAERRRAERPKVHRLPVISIRAADGTVTRHAAVETTVGRYTLRWIGTVLFVRGGYPYTNWTAFEGGSLDGLQVSVEPVEQVLEGAAPDEVTHAQWTEWLAPVGDTVSWNTGGATELTAAQRAAAEINAAANLLRGAAALPRADQAWLQEQPWLSLVPQGIAITASFEGWVHPHETGTVTHQFGVIPYAQVPRDVTILQRVVGHLDAAARLMLVRPLRACSACRTVKPSLHMHDRVTCHGCANRRYGVVY